jgi:hypothetical protein
MLKIIVGSAMGNRGGYSLRWSRGMRGGLQVELIGNDVTSLGKTDTFTPEISAVLKKKTHPGSERALSSEGEPR